MFSHQTTVITATNLDDLEARFPPNKSGNFIGMRVQLTQASEESMDMLYELAPINEEEGLTGLRWVPYAEEPGPYYYV